MAGISIDRLSLNMAGPAEPGERLARKIADGLASISLSRGSPVDFSNLTISLRGVANERDDALANRIVAELVRQLNQIA